MRVTSIDPESSSSASVAAITSHRRNKYKSRQRSCRDHGPSLPLESSMIAKRWVVSQSLLFKLGIQRMQQDPVQTMPYILDPLNLDQFMTLRRDERAASEDARFCSRGHGDGHGEREPAIDAIELIPDAAAAAPSKDVSYHSNDPCTYAAVRRPSILIGTSENGDSEDFQDCPSVLSLDQFLQIKDALPRRFQDAVLQRRFSLSRDGDCLGTLLLKISRTAHTILVIQTTRGDILGGYCAEPWSLRRRYHGNGVSFLFASDPQGSRHVRDRSKDHLFIYPWTGHNDYCQVCDDYLAMGGQGSFGWRVCSELMKGQTGWCRTYENPPLVEGGFFDIANLEVYSVIHDVFSTRKLEHSVHTASGLTVNSK